MMKDIMSKVIIGIVVCFFLFFGLKSCVFTTWESHEKPTAYYIRGVDGREMAMIFLPKFETMLWYKDSKQNFTEGVLAKMRGSYGTHYIGPLWKIDGPRAGGFFGLRWLPKGHEPIHMEIIHLDKYVDGREKSTFGDVGETFYTVIVKDTEKERIQFQGMWFEMVSYDPNEIKVLRAKFKKTE